MRLGYDLHGKRFRHFQNNYSSSELSYYLRDFFFLNLREVLEASW